MDPIVLMQSKWGETFNIPWYLFLGGMSGGILIVAAMTEIIAGDKPKYHALSGLSSLLVLPFMVIGGLALTFHLARPMRGFFFPIYMTNYSSWLTIGGWVIGVFVPVSLAIAAAWFFDIERKWRVALAIIGAPVGIFMCLYTGYLLSAAQFVPMWMEKFLPILFLLSGLSTGLAVCAINAYVVQYLPIFPQSARDRIKSANVEETAHILGLWDIGVLVLEIIWLSLFIIALGKGGVGHRWVVKVLLEGNLAPWFWWGVVVVGLALPLALGLLEPILKKIYKLESGWLVNGPFFAKLHLVLIGGLILRYVIVWGGDVSQPLIYPPQMSEIPKVRSQGSSYALSQALRKIHRR
ncbi:MAG: NrfD/PsrC family molybdoenzyme membrane anchor subunit [Nitrospinota bacterium]